MDISCLDLQRASFLRPISRYRRPNKSAYSDSAYPPALCTRSLFWPPETGPVFFDQSTQNRDALVFSSNFAPAEARGGPPLAVQCNKSLWITVILRTAWRALQRGPSWHAAVSSNAGMRPCWRPHRLRA